MCIRDSLDVIHHGMSHGVRERCLFTPKDAFRQPVARKMNVYNKGKYLLRKAFEGNWLPESILWREKAAFSDAVGHSMVDDIK